MRYSFLNWNRVYNAHWWIQLLLFFSRLFLCTGGFFCSSACAIVRMFISKYIYGTDSLESGIHILIKTGKWCCFWNGFIVVDACSHGIVYCATFFGSKISSLIANSTKQTFSHKHSTSLMRSIIVLVSPSKWKLNCWLQFNQSIWSILHGFTSSLWQFSICLTIVENMEFIYAPWVCVCACFCFVLFCFVVTLLIMRFSFIFRL